MDRIDLHHLDVDEPALPGGVLEPLVVRHRELVARNDPLDVVPDIDHDRVVDHPDDSAFQLRTNRIVLADLEPRIFLRLPQAERDPLVVGIDVQDDDID